MTTKRRHTLTLDADLVEELLDDGIPLSTSVNRILTDEVARRRRRAELRSWLDDLESELGPVDENELQHFLRLLS